MKKTQQMTGSSTQREGHTRVGICQLRTRLSVLSRAAWGLLGTVCGVYRVSAVATDFTDTVEESCSHYSTGKIEGSPPFFK